MQIITHRFNGRDMFYRIVRNDDQRSEWVRSDSILPHEKLDEYHLKMGTGDFDYESEISGIFHFYSDFQYVWDVERQDPTEEMLQSRRGTYEARHWDDYEASGMDLILLPDEIRRNPAELV